MAPSISDDDEGKDLAQEFVVDSVDAGQRLDAWLAHQMPAHVSRSRVKTLIQEGTVSCNGKVLREPSYRLKPDDALVLQIPEPDDAEPRPEAIALEILHEDEHLIVVNKPAGMVVHPAPGNWNGTLVNALLHHCGSSLKGIGGVRRPGIVHRLDKDTSGILVAAKTDEAHQGLSAQFADHGRSGPLERNYLAFVWGSPERNTGTIDAPLGRSASNRLKRAVVRADGHDAREAITHYTVIRHLDGAGDGRTNASLVECRLETGRTHQIRVHMAHIGNPLIGDQEYGAHFATKANALKEPARSAVKAFRRQALHARLLGFKHPVTSEHLRFEAPVPGDFSDLLEAFETSN
ncbi:MAG: RluA family pseudouridine synthase [Nitratireductor sp.]|nr:RluA family pseudouridine synthase [Nitratireductor sp.]MCB1460165.1 RluA family pseudouridine synthase [Nitratireductor sp.]